MAHAQMREKVEHMLRSVRSGEGSAANHCFGEGTPFTTCQDMVVCPMFCRRSPQPAEPGYYVVSRALREAPGQFIKGFAVRGPFLKRERADAALRELALRDQRAGGPSVFRVVVGYLAGKDRARPPLCYNNRERRAPRLTSCSA